MANLDQRDPNDLNSHVKSAFDDVFAEPDGTHSIDCVWALAYNCFSGCQGFWYKLITLFCGCFIACNWGIVFAFEVFRQVWYDTPCLRLCAIQCSPSQKCWTIFLQCCLAPLCDACGMYWNNIKINHIK
ncbi:caveolin-1-like isoform X2 [Dreissena polymorpha]|uniref:caveolin-1-like isoform X2 n=1 Tax=Dreissena polymorpha TaxID=45954 RepID=UPI002263E175|nr:caveolin-1-like isoform X2 [Dreissena polymorpha]